MSIGPIRFVRAMALFVLPLSFWAAAVSGQDIDFDIDIARIGGGRFEPFLVFETEPMRPAMSAGKLQSGVLRDAGGDRQEVERPLQLFSRWYGFALTFPGTAIYMP